MDISLGASARTLPRSNFADLPTPTVGLAGMHVWCTDYPSVGGFGAEVICTGSRWKSISQQHCILSPPSVPDGLLFAAGSAAALYGSTVLIPGGVLQPDDNVRLLSFSQHPSIGTGTRSIYARCATTSNGVIAGSDVVGFGHANASNNNSVIDKFATLMSNTQLKSGNNGMVGAYTSASPIASKTIPSVESDLYMGLVITPSADTSWLMFGASIYVEFAR